MKGIWGKKHMKESLQLRIYKDYTGRAVLYLKQMLAFDT